MRRRILLYVVRLEWIAVLESVNALVFGPVVLVDTAHVWHQTHRRYVSNYDRQADRALDDDHQQIVLQDVVEEVGEDEISFLAARRARAAPAAAAPDGPCDVVGVASTGQPSDSWSGVLSWHVVVSES